MFSNVWRCRHFILSSIYNELISRFIRSKLGGAWTVLNPLAQVTIYALILSNILAAKLPGLDSEYAYAIYLMAGLLMWTMFHEIVTRCLTLFIEQGPLIKKIALPKIAPPLIVLGSCIANNLLLLVSMLVIFTLLAHPLSLNILWLPFLFVTLALLALGTGLILGIVNVFVRDIGQATPIVMQVLFWFTPIVYPETIIPESYRDLLALNPLYPIVEAYHQVLVYNAPPETLPIGVIFLASALILLIGLMVFRRSQSGLMDAL
jgi:lipopolysaccharide transport system permease protein